ncbi:EDIL3-like protein [Mya arenaria]|uniref:EDIL3-like protein n=1 Tax=Mya arenaria TaxID=6604 RepID=A0ABY7D9Z8_MYAAR|nr:EDIL3-like protein [Mya arenaria]
MGIDNPMLVKDGQLTSSSNLDSMHGAAAGRLYNEFTGWAPVSTSGKQWLQVDLLEPRYVSGILTQGIPDKDMWSVQYVVSFSNDGNTFTAYSEKNGGLPMVFNANNDRNSIVKMMFNRNIVGRYVRVTPIEGGWAGIGLRFNLIGCFNISTTAPPMTTQTVVPPTLSFALPNMTTQIIPVCTIPMGIGNRYTIGANQISASSSLDIEPISSWSSGIKLPWTPVPTDPHPYVQVDFLEPKALSGVLIQGSPYKSEWVTSYQVYISLDGNTWTPYSDIVNAKIPTTFKGNNDNTGQVTNLFNRNIYGRFIRIYAISFHTAATMIFEVFGCNPSEAVNMTTTESPSGVSTLTTTVSPPAGSKNTPTITPPSRTGTPNTQGFGQTVSFTTPTYVAPPTVCLTPMGLEYTRTVFDHQITSSSKINELTGASQGRIHSNSSWIPSHNDSSPWIQVNFEKPKLLSGILIQGENGGQRWVTKYTVDFSMDGNTFYPYTLLLGDSKPVVFSGNNDSNSLVRQLFNRNVTAQYIRIHPKEWHGNAAAIRFNIIGCNPDSPQTPTVTTLSPSVTTPTNGTVCTVPMGVANTLIVKDQQLSASSSKDMFSGAERSRFDAQKDGSFYGGWVAGENNMKQYIQVDFLAPYYVGGIKTEGRSDKDQWVTQYEIYYSTDGKHYSALPKSFLDSSPMVFDANKDSGTPVTNLIHPVEWHNAIAVRFEVLGCMSPSRSRLSTTALPTTPTSQMSVTGTRPLGTGSTTGTTPASSVSPTACAYWTPWVSASKPDKEGEYESAWQLKQLVTFCDYQYVQQTECRTTGTHIPYDQTGENGVICNNDLKGLLCYAKNQTDGSCLDYEIRVFCDECASTPAVTTPAPMTCNPRWLPWINHMTPTNELSYVEHEFMSLQKQQELCFDGKITRIECQTIYGVSFHSAGSIGSTCEILSGLTCKNSDNYPVPCDDFQVRYYCDCAPRQTLHQNQTGFSTGTPTITPTGYTGTGTPTTTSPGYSETVTSTIRPPGYTGIATPTQKPGVNNNGTPTVTPPGNTGTGTPTITPPGYTGTGFPTITPTGDIGTGSPTITPTGDTGTGTPTVRPPGYTGTGTPTQKPGRNDNGTLTLSPPGNTGTDSPTITPPDYTGTGSPTITPTGDIGTGSPTITPTGDTGTGTPTVRPPGYTGSVTPTQKPGRNDNGTLTLSPPGNTGTGSPTITPRVYNGTGTSTITPTGSTGFGTQTITPTSNTGTGTLTITSTNYIGTSTRTERPPGYTGTPTLIPPGYTGKGSQSITPPGYTGTGTPTLPPTGYSGTGIPTVSPTGHSGGTPTLTPTTCAIVTKWSSWVNRHTPDATTDEIESMTAAEKLTFCGLGKIIAVECKTIDNIPSYSAGDFGFKCDITNGATCVAMDNFPIGCQDYMIRYQCREQICGETTTTSQTTDGTGTGTFSPKVPSKNTPTLTPSGGSTATPTAVPTTVCATTTRWSSWLNRDKPTTGEGDKEVMTGEEKQKFCPSGAIATVECASIDGVPSYQSMDIVDCNPITGVFCDNSVNMGMCADYMIRYQCEETTCTGPTLPPTTQSQSTLTTPQFSRTTTSPGQGVILTTYTHTETTHTGTVSTFKPPKFASSTAHPNTSGNKTPTQSPSLICETKNRWSMWIDRSTPGINGTGDHEYMTTTELQRFCARGTISGVECQTFDGTNFDKTPDFVTCTMENGLVCDGAENFPITCMDYKMRYECIEEICQTPTGLPSSAAGTPTAHPSSVTGGVPTVRPPGSYTGTPTLQPPGVTGEPTARPPNATGGVPTETPKAFYTGTPTMHPTGVSGEPTDHPQNASGGVPTVTPKALYTDTQTMQPTGVSGEPTARPPNATGGVPTETPKRSYTDIPTMHPTGVSREPTALPPNSSGGVPTLTPKESNTGIPTMHPTGVSGEPTALPPNSSGGVPTLTPTESNTGTPTMNPTGVSGEPTDHPPNSSGGVPTLTPKESNTGTPTMHPTGVSGEPTALPPNSSGGVPTLTPKESNTGTRTMHPTGISGEPTALPPKSSGGVPTLTPKESNTGTPTMHPTGVSGEPTAHLSTGRTGIPSVNRCTQSHWSSWINRDNPNIGVGDYESMTDKEKADFCIGGNIKSIECVTTDGVASYSSGEIMSCTLLNGFSCNNQHNAPVPCSDYKIRYFCLCEETSSTTSVKPTSTIPFNGTLPPTLHLTCGWSPWLNGDRPNFGSADAGDLETIGSLKTKFGLCKNIVDIACRVAGTDTLADAAGQTEVLCDSVNGLRCYNRDQQGGMCYDYEVSVLCWAAECSQQVTPTLVTGANRTTVVCPPGEVWESCAQNCSDLCESYAQSTGLCNSENPCVPMCRNPIVKHKCALGELLKDKNTCVAKQMCPCIKPDGSVAQAYETWPSPTDNCSLCQCSNNEINCKTYENCYAIPQATTTTLIPPMLNGSIPTIRPIITYPDCGWTAWINSDRPSYGNGDFEIISNIRRLHHFCVSPLLIECRDIRTHTAVKDGSQKVSCDVTTGLKCLNTDNAGGCNDYEIRFFCPCVCKFPTTVSPNPGSNRTPTQHPISASTGFPSEKPNRNFNKTTTKQPMSVSGGTPTLQPTMNNTTTNSHSTKQPVHSGVTPTMSPTAPGVGVSTAGPVLCGWTTWMDGHKPDASTGESETFSELRTIYQFCKDIDIQGIECRIKDTHAMINQTDQVNVMCTIASGGLMCFGFEQPTGRCLDYEIRIFCEPAGQVCSGTSTGKPSAGSSSLTPTLPPPEHTNGSPTNKPPGMSAKLPTAFPPGMSTKLPTAHPPRKCVERWSPWINRDTQPDGKEHEHMNATEKATFCVDGRVSGIECMTIDNIASYSSGEILECSMENGLICEDAVNAPIPCSDYKVRYHCECPALIPTNPPTTVTVPYIVCREKMGMENGHIVTNMISVSSSRDGNLNPASARLNSHGAWTPNHNDQKQYIQVNFLKPMLLTGIITQGRENSGSYVTSYKVLFSNDGFIWSPYQDYGQDKIFSGNNNSGSMATNWFDHPIRAQYIRVVPLTWKGVIALRMELLGCYEGYPTNSCIFWDVWVNEGHLTLTSGGDSEPISALQSLSERCTTPIMIDCVRASDELPYDQAGQKVKCDLWNGLQCFNADNSPLCYDYKARLVNSVSTTQPGTTSTVNKRVLRCFEGLDISACPKDGCADGLYCDGRQCVTKDKCPCLVDGQILMSGGFKERSNCETCQCIAGEVNCEPKKCSPCLQGFSLVINKTTCECSCRSCPPGEFRCGNGECIPQERRCDGIIDCIDDEVGCVSTPMFTPPVYATATPTLPPKIIGTGQPTALPPGGSTGNPLLVNGTSTTATLAPVQCNSQWTSWINTDTPDTGDGDRESWTAAQKAAFCPNGKVSRIECMTSDGIASYSSGEIMQCTIEGGAVCLTTDNAPMPCSDFKIRYFCDCNAIPTGGHPPQVSGGVPTVTPPSGRTRTTNIGSTTSMHGQISTAGPGQCTSSWSSWINTDSPDSGDGDRESLTNSQNVREDVSWSCLRCKSNNLRSWTAAGKAAFCPYGKISRIECRTIDDIASYSSGEIMQCTVEEGAVCLNNDNSPVPCSDYKIRYFCECAVSGSTTSLPGQVTTGAPVQCSSNWSSWINTDTPDSGDGDRESWTAAQKAAFCPYGKISRIECRTIDDIASYSSGEIMQCTIEGGAVCLNDDNFPVPCSDYKIKYFCECAVSGSTTSLPGQVTTGAPVQCSSNWSSWINTDTPDSGDGDRESWTAAQKAAFCPYGKISRIECRTIDDIASYSSGEIMQCTIEGGAVCLNDDNFPVPCSDYKIKYFCECAVSGSTTSLPGQVTTGAPVQCSSNWSSWINTDTPDSGDGDRESWTAAQKAAFCPYGKISRIECRTIDDIASYSSGEIMQCTIEGGAVCLNDDNFPVPCSDYKIKYFCECAVSPTLHPTGASGGIPTVTPPGVKTQTPNLGVTVSGSTTSLQGQVTTGASVQCSSNWSSWINTDTPDSGDGDRESWTAAQKAAFCPYGKISRIECRTIDDIASYSSGEIMQCTIEGGAVCLNNDNFPVPCSDYKIRYYCECTDSAASTSTSHGQVTTRAPVQCTSNWSSWINTDTPYSNDGDRENWSAAQKTAFCPHGKVTRIECRTTDDIASYSSGEVMQCSLEGGAVCLNDDNFPVPCSDYKIKYFCECTAEATLPPPIVTGQSPRTTTMGLPPTIHTTNIHGGPSVAPCLTRWSRWINRDQPDSGMGDIEKMNGHELSVFCPEGRIKGIECVTVDGKASYSNGEVLSCSINNGLECLNDNNFPVPCSDYKIRYYCDCEVSPFISVPPTPGIANHNTPVPVTNCIPEQCLPMVKPVLKEGEELQTVIDANGCCFQYIVVCKPNLCAPPILNCPAPMSLEPVTGESDCCLTYRCMCPTICPTTTKPVCKPGQDAVEIQTKCNCTSFACMTTIPGQKTCQYKLADNTTQTYQIGQSWSDGVCTHCACLDREGVADIGYKTIARPDFCCLDCQPNGCIVNGTIYKDGATVETSKKCYDKLCIFDAELDMFIVSETHVQCPAYEQLADCKANEEVYDITGCCMKCLPERNVTSLTCQTCAPRLVAGNPNDTIGYFAIMDNMEVCKNVEPIPDLLECSGFCNSRSSYSHMMQGFTDSCNCCQSTGSETRNVQLTCTNGRKVTKSYSVPKSCGCSACVGAK